MHTTISTTLLINTPHNQSEIQIKDITPILNKFDALPEHLWDNKEIKKTVALQCANNYPKDTKYKTEEVNLIFDPDQETNYIDYILDRNRNEPAFKIIGPKDITQNEILKCLQQKTFSICDHNNEIVCKVKSIIADAYLWFYFDSNATDSATNAKNYLKLHSQKDCAKRIANTLHRFRYDDAFLNDEWQIYRDIVDISLELTCDNN